MFELFVPFKTVRYNSSEKGTSLPPFLTSTLCICTHAMHVMHDNFDTSPFVFSAWLILNCTGWSFPLFSWLKTPISVWTGKWLWSCITNIVIEVCWKPVVLLALCTCFQAKNHLALHLPPLFSWLMTPISVWTGKWLCYRYFIVVLWKSYSITNIVIEVCWKPVVLLALCTCCQTKTI